MQRKYGFKLLTSNQIESIKIKENISHLSVPLEVLADIEQSDKNSQYLHEIFANLAYVHKDLQYPNWSKALKFINLAIESREKKQLERKHYVHYEINRMLCNINMKKSDEEIKNEFDLIWHLHEGRYCLMTSPPVLFPNFYEWLSEHKIENIREWLRQNFDKRDDWLDMFSSENFKEFKEKITKNL